MLGSSTLTAFRHRFCITFDRLQRECQGCWNERKHYKSSLERWRLYPTQQLGSSVHLSGTIQLMEEIQRSPVEVGSLCIPLVYKALYISGGDRKDDSFKFQDFWTIKSMTPHIFLEVENDTKKENSTFTALTSCGQVLMVWSGALNYIARLISPTPLPEKTEHIANMKGH